MRGGRRENGSTVHNAIADMVSHWHEQPDYPGRGQKNAHCPDDIRVVISDASPIETRYHNLWTLARRVIP